MPGSFPKPKNNKVTKVNNFDKMQEDIEEIKKLGRKGD